MNNLTRDQWLSTNWNITTDSEKMELWNRIDSEHLFISVQDALNYIEEVLKLKREEFKTMHAKGIDEAIVSLMYFIEKEDARYDWMIVHETNHISDIIDQVYVLWKKEFGTEQEYAIKELLKMVALYAEYVIKRSSGDFPIIFLKTYQDTIERRYYSDIILLYGQVYPNDWQKDICLWYVRKCYNLRHNNTGYENSLRSFWECHTQWNREDDFWHTEERHYKIEDEETKRFYQSMKDILDLNKF